MKRSMVAVLFVLSFCNVLLAQQFSTEKSEPFDEPAFGWNKVLQLKNGNTFYFHATTKEGIEVAVYDKNRKRIVGRAVESNLWDKGKMRSTAIKGVFEIGGEPVLFIAQANERKPTLYRMQLDPATGAVTKEEEIGSQPEMPGFSGRYMLYNNVDMSDITIEKDAGSDCYAVMFLNSYPYDSSQKIKVVHYSGTHQPISTAFCNAFGHMGYLTAVVDGDKRVFLLTGRADGNQGADCYSDLVISRLNNGSSVFDQKSLLFPGQLKETKAQMLYDLGSNKLRLLALNLSVTNKESKEKTTSYYSTYVCNIDPETLSLSDAHPLSVEKVNAYAKEYVDKQYEYVGIPQYMTINKDNSTTVLSEEIRQVRYGYKGESGGQTNTTLGPIGISVLSDTGRELLGYMIRKKQMAEGQFPKLYIAERKKGYYKSAQTLISQPDNNAFLTFDYIDAPHGRYIIFNELPGNLDPAEVDKSKIVSSVSETSAICYRLDSGKLDYFHLFGDPDATNSNTFCYIQSSDFKKETNTYASLVVERNGRDKQARIVWLTFQ